ncbi:hypothetical protein BHE74_00018198, partial [Ensete ventricosum]
MELFTLFFVLLFLDSRIGPLNLKKFLLLKEKENLISLRHAEIHYKIRCSCGMVCQDAVLVESKVPSQEMRMKRVLCFGDM